MKKTKLFGLLSALMLALFLTACSSGNQATPKEAKQENQSYTVTDDAGKKITFDKAPEKVVSLTPSNTEILFALGAGDKVVGVTDFDDYPEEAKKIQRVSDTSNVNSEAIIALKPDAIIAYDTFEKSALKPLEDAGIPVFIIESAATFDAVYGNIEQIAAVMGEEKKGKKLIADIKGQINSVEEKVTTVKEKEKVYLEIEPAPNIFTTGSETFQQEVLASAGVENIFADQKGWVKLSEEEVLKRNPNNILTTVSYTKDPIGEIKSRNGWDKINAVKNDDVYLLDANIMSRQGPRIGEAVELVAKTVYPDLFK